MSAIILCTTGADCLCYIDVDSYEVRKVFYKSEKPIGPHGVKSYNDIIVTANNYNDSISIFNKNTFEEIENIKTGPKPNDVLIVNNKLYAICGESNCLEIFDTINYRKNMEVPTGIWPHSIDYLESKQIILVTNLEENCITIVDEKQSEVIGKILTPEYPIKVKVSNDNKYVYVCESYLGSDYNGYIDVFSTDNFQRVNRIEVGSAPVDLFEDNDNIYVSNFTDGSVTVINKKDYVVSKTLFIGGMPKGIVKINNSIYVADYLKNRVIVFDHSEIKKVIAIEAEPNAMTIF